MCYITMNEETHLDNNGINIWELPAHLCTCPKCHGSGEGRWEIPSDVYRKVCGTWETGSAKCLYCNGAGYIERELDKGLT